MLMIISFPQKKKKKKENLSGRTLVLFVNLEIGARYLLVVSIGLLLLLLGFPLRRPFQMWYREGAGDFGLHKWHSCIDIIGWTLLLYCSLEASATS